MSAATVQIDDSGNAAITFEFSYSAVEEIKARIPVYARSYDSVSKVWTIQRGPFVALAIDILRDIYGCANVQILQKARSA